MGIASKSFSWAQKIRRTLFLGRPAFFNASDLNREFEGIHEAGDALSNLVGGTTTSVVTITNYLNQVVGLNYVRSYDWAVSAGYVTLRGVRYTVPASSGSFTQTLPIPAGSPLPTPPVEYFVLSAAKVVKTFATDQALCGITSTEYPTLVPSVDQEVFQGEMITIVSSNPLAVTDFICILATYAPRYNDATGLVEWSLYRNVRTPQTHSFVKGSGNYASATFASNDTIMEELLSKLDNLDSSNLAKLGIFENRFTKQQSWNAPNTPVVISPTTNLLLVNKNGNMFEASVAATAVIDNIVLGVSPTVELPVGTLLAIKFTYIAPSLVSKPSFGTNFFSAPQILDGESCMMYRTSSGKWIVLARTRQQDDLSAINATLAAHTAQLSLIDLGDVLGVQGLSLSNAAPLVTLTVGLSKVYQYINFFPVTLTADILINLSKVNAGATTCKNGNRFNLHFKQHVTLNGFNLRIVTDYVNPSTYTTLKTFTASDAAFLLSSEQGISIDATFDGTNWILNNTNETAGEPFGIMVDYPVSIPPAGWLLCDGAAVSRTAYSRIFTLFGTQFGIGNGTTTFNLPDFRRRVSLGFDASGGSDADFTDSIASENSGRIGAKGGENTHDLSAGEIPSHTHNLTGGGDISDGFGTLPARSYSTNPILFSTDGGSGGGNAHENRMPYIVLAKIIKY